MYMQFSDRGKWKRATNSYLWRGTTDISRPSKTKSVWGLTPEVWTMLLILVLYPFAYFFVQLIMVTWSKIGSVFKCEPFVYLPSLVGFLRYSFSYRQQLADCHISRRNVKKCSERREINKWVAIRAIKFKACDPDLTGNFFYRKLGSPSQGKPNNDKNPTQPTLFPLVQTISFTCTRTHTHIYSNKFWKNAFCQANNYLEIPPVLGIIYKLTE